MCYYKTAQILSASQLNSSLFKIGSRKAKRDTVEYSALRLSS